MMRAAFVVLAAILACTGSDPVPEQPTDEVPETPEAPEPAPVVPAFATAGWAIWKAPTDDKNIPDPDGGEGTVKNYITNVARGDRMDRTEVGDGWVKVKVEDGTEGWIKADRVVEAENGRLATVVAESKMFDRPDLIALDINKKLPAAAFLIVAESEGKFSKVNYPTGKYSAEDTWALTANLEFDTQEVEAAKIIARIMELREKGDTDGAAQLEDLARGQFVGSKLLAVLDVVEVPEEEGGDEGEAPSE
ncbi:MAG: SH3 domain-containing protein [Myxococcales bacterium]|nr:SH3 domain-containing protein [Myxococcales bacterium]